MNRVAVLASFSILGVLGWSHAPRAQEAELPAPTVPGCTMDLSRVQTMRDIVSNALIRGVGVEEAKVRTFLETAVPDCQDGPRLFHLASRTFDVPVPKLAAVVERFRHVNCTHDGGQAAGRDEATPESPPFLLPQFAADVTLHVVLHEIAHALIREFDLPVLGNEETAADAFATHYLTAHLPERAPDVLAARVASLMFEAGEVPRAEWPVRGEHGSDARRAHQIAALAFAADPERYARVADLVSMTAEDRKRSADYGTEIHRSWRRVLEPLWMPEGMASNEVGIAFERSPACDAVRGSALPGEIEAALRSFDWHSRVTVRFVEGDGGAAWSRSRRRITVHGGYVRRFVAQDAALAAARGEEEVEPGVRIIR